jgi:pyridoxal 5'-phosphate synthase pdxT subunit
VTQRVGILGYQGAIEPHEAMLAQLGAPTIRVRSAEDLATIDRIILPGGESSTMLRLLKLHDLFGPLQYFARTKPTWGICAGSILLARTVTNPTQESLDAIDIAAHRNFYGSQLDSFSTTLSVAGLSQPIPAQFIRAPRLSPLNETSKREPLTIIATHQNTPVFFQQGRVWACAFHVELGNDPSLHELFLRL